MNDANSATARAGIAPSAASGVSSETADLLETEDVLEPRSDPRRHGATHDDLRDAAWADQLWR
ncbi:hypothetical protein E8P82_01605 [Arthrobacter echini]|uniref:Uncharacterized protein n=1 Tax=Arthrobacter echini TaxID=1529066 RepID=A0A4S5EA77_9MICC|nr:hypothetical protein [Arthrobacter echini]THJ68625.1 hypothetical protein E8P82_01605 [Arthrobacter echini]